MHSRRLNVCAVALTLALITTPTPSVAATPANSASPVLLVTHGEANWAKVPYVSGHIHFNSALVKKASFLIAGKRKALLNFVTRSALLHGTRITRDTTQSKFFNIPSVNADTPRYGYENQIVRYRAIDTRGKTILTTGWLPGIASAPQELLIKIAPESCSLTEGRADTCHVPTVTPKHFLRADLAVLLAQGPGMMSQVADAYAKALRVVLTRDVPFRREAGNVYCPSLPKYIATGIVMIPLHRGHPYYGYALTFDEKVRRIDLFKKAPDVQLIANQGVWEPTLRQIIF